jgi:hypothetical protein
MALRIGIVGPGNVGTTLGARLSRARAPVKYGSREPARHPTLGRGAVLLVQDVCEWADVVILAVPGFRTPAAARALARSLGPGIEGPRGGRRAGARAVLPRPPRAAACRRAPPRAAAAWRAQAGSHARRGLLPSAKARARWPPTASTARHQQVKW